VRWLSRDELRTACQSGEVRLPPRISIARMLIERWFGEPIPNEWGRN
jgi:NAD+ diphosphatase